MSDAGKPPIVVETTWATLLLLMMLWTLLTALCCFALFIDSLPAPAPHFSIQNYYANSDDFVPENIVVGKVLPLKKRHR